MQKSKYDGIFKIMFRFPVNLKALKRTLRIRHKNASTLQLKYMQQHGFNTLWYAAEM